MLFSDPEFQQMARDRRRDDAKLEAERVTAEWKTRAARKLADLSETPLFGGEKQQAMFPEEN
jgi:hypothetical protein